MWKVIKDSPAIFLAVFFPKAFLVLYKSILPDRWAKKTTPIARYCRSRLLKPKDIRTIANPHHADNLAHVAIVIPNYNYNNFISKAIGSAFEAAEEALKHGIKTEVIIVDDNSNDGSRTTIEHVIHERDIPAKALFLKSNCGLSNARNTGMNASHAEFLLFLDSDNWLTKDAVILLYNALKGNTSTACFGRIRTWHHKNGKQGEDFSAQPYDLNRLLTKENYIDAMAMFRKKKLAAIGGFSTSLQLISWGYEDYAMWIKLGTSGHSVTNISDVIGDYLFKDDSLVNLASADRRFTLKWLKYRGRIRLVTRKLFS